MKKTLFLSIIIFKCCVGIFAQNPPNVEWKQIKTREATIIFPQELEPRAQIIAKQILNNKEQVNHNLRLNARHIRLYLFNKGVETNGYVALAPRQTVWYTTPPMSVNYLGGGDWFNLLSLHEMRHVAQYDNYNQEFVKYIGLFFGDYGRAVLMNFGTPRWYMEGDAVVTETLYSNYGRGRLPYFSLHTRAIIQNEKKYSYNKLYLGSYKHFVPDYYKLGYYMCTWLYGTNEMNTGNYIIEHSTKHAYNPFIFSRSLKLNTGYRVGKSYRLMREDLKQHWNNRQEWDLISKEYITNETSLKNWVNYTQPYKTREGQLLAYKKGYSVAGELISVGNNNVKKKIIDIDPYERVTFCNDKAAWIRTYNDIRYYEQSYNDLMVYSLETGELKRLSEKKKYFLPAFSPDGSKIIVVEYLPDLKCSLVVIDANSGNIIQTIPFGFNVVIRDPAWNSNGSQLVYTKQTGDKLNLIVYDINKKEEKIIPLEEYELVSRPAFWGNYLLFNTQVNKIDEIHAINIYSNERYIVANGEYGVYNVAVDEKSQTMYFQDYRPSGFQIAKIDLDTLMWKRFVRDDSKKYYFEKWLTYEVKSQNNIGNNFSSPDTFEVTGYKKFKDKFHFHSWAPYTNNVDEFGLQVISNNALNTLDIVGGVAYNSSIKQARFFADIVYREYFPVLSVGAFANQVNSFLEEDIDIKSSGGHIGVELPFNFSNSMFTHTLSIGSDFSAYNSDATYGENATTRVVEGNIFQFQHDLSYLHSKRLAYRDFKSPFSQALNISIIHSVLSSAITEGKINMLGEVTFPGLFNHQYLTFNAKLSSLINKEDNVIIEDFIENIAYTPIRVFSDKQYSVGADYTFPLLYPDLNLGALLYLKRINANLFYHYTWAYNNQLDTDYVIPDENYKLGSMGGDINFEYHFLRLPIALNTGVRLSYVKEFSSIFIIPLIFGIQL